MSIADIAGTLFGWLLRAIGGIVSEGVLDIAVRGPGYVLCRTLKKDIDPDSLWVILAGFALWAVVGVIGYMAFSYLAQLLAIDRCLDSGGAFDYRNNRCVRG